MSFESYDLSDLNGSNGIDINFVLVHGLNGDSTAFENDITKKSMISSLLSTFPRSRVIKYCYPNESISNYFQTLCHQHPLPIEERGLNFLQGLVTEIKDNKCMINFIGHSMGGLVIKQCLITASSSNNEKYKDILKRTKSVSFYATPHNGSYLADIYSKLPIVTVAVHQLKDNNPFLIELKNNFNDIVQKNKIKILSIIEAQKFMGIINIVQSGSAVCGLTDKYEQCHKLDYDHTQIQRPEGIHDRRFTHYYEFITTTVFDAKTQLIRYKQDNDDNKTSDINDENINDEDEKEGYHDNEKQKILHFDPKDNTSEDIQNALNLFDKEQTLESFMAMTAALLKKQSRDYRQKNLQNAFQHDVVKQNKKILENLLKTKELMDYIDPQRIKQSINLSLEYWELLKESKMAIKLKKNQIDLLLDVCAEWKDVIDRRLDLKESQQMDEEDISFLEYVCDEFKAWFKDNDKIASIANKWDKLHGKLREEHVWWKTEATRIKKTLQEKANKMKDKVKEQCITWLGCLIVGLGAIVICAAVVVAIVVVAPVGIACSIGVGGAALGVGGVAVGGYIAYKGFNMKKYSQKEIANMNDIASKSENLIRKNEMIVKAYKEMSNDAGGMDKLFDDFMRKTSTPKGRVDKIEKMNNRLFKMMKRHVIAVYDSFVELQRVSQEILDKVDDAQNKFNSDY